MMCRAFFYVPFTVLMAAGVPGFAQPSAPASQGANVKATLDEVLLDFVVRDKKGKPVTDLKPEDLAVTDNGAREQISSFRLVQGPDAITQSGASKLDPLRQVRLATLVFESLDEADRRKTARTAAIDLVKGEQGANTFYSVVVINSKLMVLQQFTNDREELVKAINEATGGLSAARLSPESDRIKSDLKRYLGVQTSGDQSQVTQSAAVTATKPLPAGAGAGDAAVQAKLASVMLDMLRMDAAMATEDARLSISALESLVGGLQSMPGRKSILYFSAGMTLPPELDAMFRNLESMANRANVTFYSVDTRGVVAGYGVNTRDVSTGAQNSGAADQLGGAASAIATTITRTEGAVTKEEVMAGDKAETSSRANVQLPLRNLAEATGGFLIGESNDLRTPLRRVNEEIASYYELSYNPHIDNYDGSFHRLKLSTERKDLRISARNGYFALPPAARAAGLETFELPLLKAISDAQVSNDVEFRAGAVQLQPRDQERDLDVLVEVPLHGLQPKSEPGKNTMDVHLSLGALVKDSKGEVVGPKLTRDRSFKVSAEQLRLGNFVEKLPISVPPGKYSLETAVMDRESGKIGVQKSDFTVATKAKGVAISSLTNVRSFSPSKGDAKDPFQFQGQTITPTLNGSIPKSANAVLRLFFVVYQDRSIAAKPTVEIEFLLDGKSLTKVPLPLPDADPDGRIPYVMTIPAAAIPAGNYVVRATVKQGESTAQSETTVNIEAL